MEAPKPRKGARALRVIMILILCLLGSRNGYAGGPWTPEKGTGLVIVNFSPNVYGQLSNGQGRFLRLNRRVFDITLQGYIEAGITDRLAVVGNLPARVCGTGSAILDNSDYSDTLNPAAWVGAGNPELELKYQFLKKGDWVAAIALKGIFTGSLQDTTSGIKTGYACQGVAPWLHVGKSFNRRFYTQFGSGIEFRNQGYDEVVHGYLEAGWRSKKKDNWFAALIQLRKSLHNATYIEHPNYYNTGLYIVEEEYLALSFKGSFPFGIPWSEKEESNWRFHVSMGGGLAFTRWIAVTPAGTAGVSYAWDARK